MSLPTSINERTRSRANQLLTELQSVVDQLSTCYQRIISHLINESLAIPFYDLHIIHHTSAKAGEQFSTLVESVLSVFCVEKDRRPKDAFSSRYVSLL